MAKKGIWDLMLKYKILSEVKDCSLTSIFAPSTPALLRLQSLIISTDLGGHPILSSDIFSTVCSSCSDDYDGVAQDGASLRGNSAMREFCNGIPLVLCWGITLQNRCKFNSNEISKNKKKSSRMSIGEKQNGILSIAYIILHLKRSSLSSTSLKAFPSPSKSNFPTVRSLFLLSVVQATGLIRTSVAPLITYPDSGNSSTGKYHSFMLNSGTGVLSNVDDSNLNQLFCSHIKLPLLICIRNQQSLKDWNWMQKLDDENLLLLSKDVAPRIMQVSKLLPNSAFHLRKEAPQSDPKSSPCDGSSKCNDFISLKFFKTAFG
ncbi:hypothetical protein QQP08_025193 [Theobroma cacao]|nr:hypothetical protein QQP08_025193 [Theobroma cacao]